VKDLHGSQAIDAVDVHAAGRCSLRCCSDVELDDAPLESDREWNGMISNHTRCSLFRILISGWWISMFAQVKLKTKSCVTLPCNTIYIDTQVVTIKFEKNRLTPCGDGQSRRVSSTQGFRSEFCCRPCHSLFGCGVQPMHSL
jgi:hypothetical protein